MQDVLMPSGGATSPDFDHAMALAAVGGSAPLLKQVAEVFLMHHSAVCTQLDAVLGSADHAQLKEIAHDLKGMGASIGAMALSSVAREVEVLAPRGPSPELDRAVIRMRDALARVHGVMQTIAQT